ncbi:MAG TPA: ABC transporter substrate binding protein [Gammaproteobacteria bacterium]|nr:ABC transporter substrate binding protein [Gammaproteobacteria bacterium]
MVKLFVTIFIAISASTVLLAPAIAAPESTAPQQNAILLLSSDDGALYQDFIDAFRNRLNELHDKPVTALDIRILGQPYSLDNPALVITVGSQATATVLRHKNAAQNPPILATLIPRPAFALLADNPKAQRALASGKLSAVYLDQPFARQINLIKLLLPNATAIGSILGPASQHQKAELAHSAREHGLTLNIALLTSDEPDPLPALRTLLSPEQASDVILALPDRAVYNRFTIRPLLLATFRQNVPVFAYSESLVGAGAVAGVYSTPEQLGWQAAETAYAFLQQPAAERKLPAPAYPVYFKVSVNSRISDLLGLNPPAAAALELRMEAMESDENSWQARGAK